MDVIYLDNNATTRPAPEVVEVMLPYLRDIYGNPSSTHRMGQLARQAIDIAHAHVAKLIGSSDSEIVFTGGGTEAINAAIRGLLAVRTPRNRIVTTAVEHSATRELCQQLSYTGTEIVYLNVDRTGTLDMDEFQTALTDDTALVSIMWANNETGVIFPVKEIASLCNARRIPFHCDATQVVGKLPVDVKEIGFDAMSFAAHKFHGPKGVGALYLRRGQRFRPFVIGGPQENKRRGGTENVPGIVGMGKAAELALASLSDMPRIAQLRDRLEQSILSTIPNSYVNGCTDFRIPNTSNIAFAQLEAEAILILLSEKGICASAGAACSSGSLEPSHVLRAMRIDEKIAHGSIRFSLSRYTAPSEIDQTLSLLPQVIQHLRQVLPVS